MSIDNTVIGGTQVTPQLIAELFWEMASDEMCDFFAHLDSISEHKLCLQMAFTSEEMRLRAEKGDWSARHGFQTMLNHAESMGESWAECRAYHAKHDIARMVKGASA